MSSNEVDVINHLLEVEKAASELTASAQKDAEKILSEAKADADYQFKSRLEKINANLEVDLQSRIKACDEKTSAEISSYKERISSSVKNQKDFNSLLDSIFAGKEIKVSGARA